MDAIFGDYERVDGYVPKLPPVDLYDRPAPESPEARFRRGLTLIGITDPAAQDRHWRERTHGGPVG